MKALRKGYHLIKSLLQEISKDMNESPTSRHEAKYLHSSLSKLETALLTVVWDAILQRINMVNKTLQSSTGDVSSIIPLYESLNKFFQLVRDQYDIYEKEAFMLVGKNVTYSVQRKRKISKRLDSLQKNEHSFSTRESFRCTCHNVICDALITQLKKRIEAYVKIDEKYGFLYNKTLPTSEVKKFAEEFQNTFSEDIDDTFTDEFLQFGAFFKEKNSPKDCLQKIRNLNMLHTFPNIEIAYRLFLTLPITNCSSHFLY